MVCESIFTAPPRKNGWRRCLQSKKRLCYNFLGDSKSQRAYKLHYWFKSYGDFAEWVNFAYLRSFIGKGLRLQPAQQAFQSIDPLSRCFHRVAMSVFISVCLSIPFPCYFFSGLLMALRSHDQFKASDWSTIPPHPTPRGRGGGLLKSPLVAVAAAATGREGGGVLYLFSFLFFFGRKSPLAGATAMGNDKKNA